MSNDFQSDLQGIVENFQNPEYGAKRLKDIYLFANFTLEELVRLYSIGRLIKRKPKTQVIIEGEPTRGLFILLYGKVSVYKTDPQTSQLVRLAILEEGANFGELTLFDEAPRSATVTSESLCFLFQLDANPFNLFLDREGDNLKMRFYKTCAEEMAKRMRVLNADYITSQQILWRYALRKEDKPDDKKVKHLRKVS